MSYRPQYYDSNIYMQSTNLILKAADLYYNQGMRQQEISEQLEISVSTVSRLLKKAKEHGALIGIHCENWDLRIYSDNCIGLVYNLASIPAATFASS